MAVEGSANLPEIIKVHWEQEESTLGGHDGSGGVKVQRVEEEPEVEVVPGQKSCCKMRFGNHSIHRRKGGCCRNQFNLFSNFILTSTVQQVVSHVLILLTTYYHLVCTQHGSHKPEKRLFSQAENRATFLPLTVTSFFAGHLLLLFPDQPGIC